MQLTTERLVLREFVEADWEALLAYHNDPRYLRFYPQDGESEAGARLFVQRFVDQQKELPRTKFQLAACLRESGRLIGNAGIRVRSLGGHETGVRQADIGNEIDPNYWGLGYATEAAQAILNFGFQELQLHRIWAQVLAENSASQRVLEKLGMHLEGRLHEDEYFKGQRWDTLIYAILYDEWKSKKG